MATKPQEQPAQPQSEEIPLSLNEFCASYSLADKRVEMIGAFFSMQKKAGNMQNTRSKYMALFNEFANAPA
jgi:hypothetical protein